MVIVTAVQAQTVSTPSNCFASSANAAAVEQAGEAIVAGGCGRCKKTDCNGAPNAVAEVDGNRADRVIDMELIVEQPKRRTGKGDRPQCR